MDSDGWSNFKLTDINSHCMIVGTAEKAGSKKVVARLKMDLEIEKEELFLLEEKTLSIDGADYFPTNL